MEKGRLRVGMGGRVTVLVITEDRGSADALYQWGRREVWNEQLKRQLVNTAILSPSPLYGVSAK